MEHYPDIVRRDGTLFFACADGDRAAIATSIERLIDMLDAMDGDPDLEPYLAATGQPEDGAGDEREGDDADYEPWLAAAERHPNAHSWEDTPRTHTQEAWSQGTCDECEDDGDDLEPAVDSEPTFSWQNEGSQESLANGGAFGEELEPDLGWTGHGTGIRDGEIHHDTEANGDELDLNGDEGDYSVGIEDVGAGSTGYNGSGVRIADGLIRGLPTAASRARAYQALGVFPLVYDMRAMGR